MFVLVVLAVAGVCVGGGGVCHDIGQLQKPEQ